MISTSDHNTQLQKDGYTIISDIYTPDELTTIIDKIESHQATCDNFRRSKDIFAIRQFIKEIPEITDLIFTNHTKNIVRDYFGKDYFLVKSIYFDKPSTSNWFVSYHQDISIAVTEKMAIDGFTKWTVKKNQYGVIPPVSLLENICTLRIHLDTATTENGALKVITASHKQGIYKSENIDKKKETEMICNVTQGSVMLMKPLLLHSSGKTTNNQRRRVIHLEFSDIELPNSLEWSEKMLIK